MPYLISNNSTDERFPVERVGLNYPITLLLPYSAIMNSKQCGFGFMRELIQADIDDRESPPAIDVLSVVMPAEGGEIVSAATVGQIGYLAACAIVDLGADHPGVAELVAYAAELSAEGAHENYGD